MARDLQERSVVRRSSRRRPRADQLVIRWLILLIALAAFALVAFRVARSGSLPAVELAGADVGALDEDALIDRVRQVAAAREAQEVDIRRAGTDDEPPVTRSYPRAELGYAVNVDATVERVLERGRQTNPVAAFADHIVASFGTLAMDPVVSLDHERLDAWVRHVREQLATDATEGGLTFRRGEVQNVLPQPGVTIDAEALRKGAEDVVFGDDLALTGPVEPLDAHMTAAEVRRAGRRARHILSGPITLRRSGNETILTPLQIGRALVTRVVEEGGTTRLRIAVDAQELASAAADALDDLRQEPSDAGFELSAGRVRVLGSRSGSAVATEKLSGALIRIALSKDRTAIAPVQKVQPEFSTAEAKDLKIVEQVSSFTTYHSCCEPRVENIHRIADIIDGSIVKPGETFSINDRVGIRTRANGFIGAPAISNGEYVEEVGGGISQFATTIFNATFFGGYEFAEYKAHSYYISRYPMGREATVSWPAPDFEFINDSGSGIYIDTSYSDTSITVTFYGRKERQVRAVAGQPHSYTAPKRRCEENRSLKRGQTRVIQSGSRGFDITVERVFGTGEREELNTTYLPVPEIIEKKKCN